MTPANEPGVDLAEVLVDGVDVGAALLDRERDDQPAGEVHAPRAGGDELGRDRLELLAPAAGHDRVQPLDHRLGADVGGDLRAGVGLAVVRHLGHRAKADRAGRERPAEQGGRLGVGARGRVRAGVRVVGHESPLRVGCASAADADARVVAAPIGAGRRLLRAQAASELGVCCSPASARNRDGPPVGRRPRSATWVISSRSLARVAAT